MSPRMLAISGPLKGSEFPLNAGELVIGREPSKAIWLERSIRRFRGGIAWCARGTGGA